MKLLVCGGSMYGWMLDPKTKKLIRNIEEFDTLNDTLDEFLNPDLRLISGHAFGVDQLVEEYAFRHTVPIYIFPARWGSFNKAAGPIRNQHMLTEGKPDKV